MLHMQKVGPGPEPKKKVPALAQLFQPSASCIPAKPTNSTTFFITKNLLLPQILPLVLQNLRKVVQLDGSRRPDEGPNPEGVSELSFNDEYVECSVASIEWEC